MTAYALTAAAPAAPKPKLALVALLVLAVHALLLLGLPRWARLVPVTGGPPVFQTRTIALAPPQPAATETAPAPLPRPKPKPRPKSRPAPAVPPVPEAPVAPPLRSGTAALGGKPLPVVTVSAPHPPAVAATTASSTDGSLSLLQAPSPVAFGGKAPLPPIVAPLPPEQVPAVLQQAAQPSPAAPDVNTPGAPEPFPPVLLPRPAELTYQATVAEGDRRTTLRSIINWRHDGQFYDLRWVLYGPAIGDRSRYAIGLVTARGLTPVTASAMGNYAYNLTFDYAQSRLRNNPQPSAAASDAASIALPPGAQDTISIWIELGALIAGDPSQYPVGSRIALPVADGHDPAVPTMAYTILDDNGFSAAGKFAGQTLPALHLLHEPANERDARVELWLGKQIDYLPVRLLISQTNGSQIDLTLQSAYTQTVLTRPDAPAAPPASPANPANPNSVINGFGGS